MELPGTIYDYDNPYWAQLPDRAVEANITPSTTSGLFESFDSNDLGISIIQEVWNLGNTYNEDWCSTSFQSIEDVVDPIIDVPSSTCGAPILEPIVVNFTPPEDDSS